MIQRWGSAPIGGGARSWKTRPGLARRLVQVGLHTLVANYWPSLLSHCPERTVPTLITGYPQSGPQHLGISPGARTGKVTAAGAQQNRIALHRFTRRRRRVVRVGVRPARPRGPGPPVLALSARPWCAAVRPAGCLVSGGRPGGTGDGDSGCCPAQGPRRIGGDGSCRARSFGCRVWRSARAADG
jgi:hypothetical protein